VDCGGEPDGFAEKRRRAEAAVADDFGGDALCEPPGQAPAASAQADAENPPEPVSASTIIPQSTTTPVD